MPAKKKPAKKKHVVKKAKTTVKKTSRARKAKAPVQPVPSITPIPVTPTAGSAMGVPLPLAGTATSSPSPAAAPLGAPLPTSLPPAAPLAIPQTVPSAISATVGLSLNASSPGATLPPPGVSLGTPVPTAFPPKNAVIAPPADSRHPRLRRFFHSRIVRFGLPLAGIVFAFIIARTLPCSVNGDFSTWQMWGRIAPNLVCTLDISNHATRLSSAELNKRIGAFKNLTALNLANNKLGTISPALFGLTNLQVLVLDGNRLTAVPPDINKLWRLSQLSLRGNVIKELPENLMNMQSLVRLNVASNRLRNVPKSMKNMQNLQSLNIANNAMSGVTLEVKSLTQLSQLLIGPTKLSATAQKKIESAMPNTLVIWGDDNGAFTGPSWHEPFTTFGSGNTLQVRQAGIARAPLVANTISIPTAPPVKKNSSAISSSAKAAAKNAPVQPGSVPTCPNGVTVGSYNFCIPDNWTSSVDLATKTVDLLDAEGNSVATISCPLQPETYKNWAITVTSRAYSKKDRLYSAELFAGRAVDDTSDDLLVLLVHLYDLEHWFGDTVNDQKESCMVKSKQPSIDVNIFKTMLSTVY